jgi:hypothetical protein
MSDMSWLRKEDTGLVYWLQEQFTSYPFIKVVDGFPEDVELTIPSVSVEPDTIEDFPVQLGDRVGSNLRTWYFDVFAKNKPQRDELAYKIYDDLAEGVIIYEIVDGQKTATKIGHLNVLKKRIKMIRIDAALVSKMYYRATVSVLVQNDILKGEI